MNNEHITKFDSQLEQLTIDELVLLNKLVVKRIKYLQSARNMQQMNKFFEGDYIYFLYNGKKITGRIIKFNQKTVSVLTDNNEKWNVHPGFLKKDEGKRSSTL